MAYSSREDFAAKVDWEGGVYKALELGVRVEDVPDGDDELREAWLAIQVIFLLAEPASNRVYDILFGAHGH